MQIYIGGRSGHPGIECRHAYCSFVLLLHGLLVSRFFVNLSLRLYRFLPWLLGLAALLLATAGALFGYIYWWVLPHIGEYRDEFAKVLSNATGYDIAIARVAGEWQGARPRLEVSGVDIRSAQGQTLLHVARIDGRFGWLSFLLLKPRFYTLNVYDTPLVVRRVSADLLYVDGLPVPLKGPGNPAFRDWLLDQGHVRWVNGTVTWVDQMKGAPPLVLTGVNAELRNLFAFHRFEVRGVPPATLAGPLKIAGQFTRHGFLGGKTWSGAMTLVAPGLDLRNVRPWLPTAYAGLSGNGEATLTLEIRQDRLAALSARVQLQNLALPLGGPALLRLASVQGEGGWKKDKSTVTWHARRLQLRAAGTPRPSALDFTYTQAAASRSLQASGLDLAALAPLAAALPQDGPLLADWRALRPSGRIDSLTLAWSGPAGHPAIERLTARFHRLAWQPWQDIPGVAGVSGEITGRGRQGTFRVQGPMALAFPQVMSQPQYAFAQFQAYGSWQHDSAGWALSIRQLDAANPELSVSLAGDYQSDGHGPGRADLRGKIVRAEAPAVWRYIPRTVHGEVADWLHRALRAGKVGRGDFVLRGDLAHFPFADGKQGEFHVSVPVQGVRLHFAPGWPALDGIAGTLVFQGQSLAISAQQGSFGGVRLGGVSADIADLGSRDARLKLSGTATGPAQDFLSFINASPILDHLQGLTRGLRGEGRAKLDLALQVPLAHSHDTQVQGKVRFENNTFTTPGGRLAVDGVHGTLNFTDQSVAAPKLALRLFGGPVALALATRDGGVVAQAEGWA